MDCDTCDKLFCKCTRDYLAGKREEALGYKSYFLYKNGITTYSNGNALISFDWYTPVYIHLNKFSFRWKGDKVRVEKKQRFRRLDSKLRESRCKGMIVKDALVRAPVYMFNFMNRSEVIFSPECFEFLGYKKSNEDLQFEKEYLSPKLNFGKYKGKSIEWVANRDFQYLEWLFNSPRDKNSWLYKQLSKYFTEVNNLV